MRLAMSGRRAVTVGLVSAALCMLTACGGSGGSQPTTLPALKSSGVASTPTSTSPRAGVPSTAASPDAQAALRASAEQFVRQYYATADLVQTRRQPPTVWRQLFTDHCTRCLEDYNAITGAVRAGDRFEGANYRLFAASVEAIDGEGGTVLVTYDVTPGLVRDSRGRVLEKDKGSGRKKAGVSIERHGLSWQVVFIVELGAA